jgi:hypothetical protein
MAGWRAHDDHGYGRFVTKVTATWLYGRPKPGSRSAFWSNVRVQEQPIGGTKCCDHGVGERALSFLECDHGSENTLLVLHNEHVVCSTRSNRPDDFIGC